jgi:hypothetical protein
MPTPDASQFTQFKKYRAIDSRSTHFPSGQNSHLYQPVPSVILNNINDFLPSFSNKEVTPLTYSPINNTPISRTNNGYIPPTLAGARPY